MFVLSPINLQTKHGNGSEIKVHLLRPLISKRPVLYLSRLRLRLPLNVRIMGLHQSPRPAPVPPTDTILNALHHDIIRMQNGREQQGQRGSTFPLVRVSPADRRRMLIDIIDAVLEITSDFDDTDGPNHPENSFHEHFGDQQSPNCL